MDCMPVHRIPPYFFFSLLVAASQLSVFTSYNWDNSNDIRKATFKTQTLLDCKGLLSVHCKYDPKLI